MSFETTKIGDRGLFIRRPPSPSISCGRGRKPARSRRPLRQMRASRLRKGHLTQATRPSVPGSKKASSWSNHTNTEQNVCGTGRGCFHRLRRYSAEPKDAKSTTGRSGHPSGRGEIRKRPRNLGARNDPRVGLPRRFVGGKPPKFEILSGKVSHSGAAGQPVNPGHGNTPE